MLYINDHPHRLHSARSVPKILIHGSNCDTLQQDLDVMSNFNTWLIENKLIFNTGINFNNIQNRNPHKPSRKIG